MWGESKPDAWIHIEKPRADWAVSAACSLRWHYVDMTVRSVVSHKDIKTAVLSPPNPPPPAPGGGGGGGFGSSSRCTSGDACLGFLRLLPCLVSSGSPYISSQNRSASRKPHLRHSRHLRPPFCQRHQLRCFADMACCDQPVPALDHGPAHVATLHQVSFCFCLLDGGS